LAARIGKQMQETATRARPATIVEHSRSSCSRWCLPCVHPSVPSFIGHGVTGRSHPCHQRVAAERWLCTRPEVPMGGGAAPMGGRRQGPTLAASTTVAWLTVTNELCRELSVLGNLSWGEQRRGIFIIFKLLFSYFYFVTGLINGPHSMSANWCCQMGRTYQISCRFAFNLCSVLFGKILEEM
jgi:hypothetical protein